MEFDFNRNKKNFFNFFCCCCCIRLFDFNKYKIKFYLFDLIFYIYNIYLHIKLETLIQTITLSIKSNKNLN